MNKKIGAIAGLVIVVLLFMMTKFSGENKSNIDEQDKELIKIEHAQGTTELNKNPKRIVVFDYSVLDVIEVLDIEGVVGVPQDTSMPSYLSKYSTSEYSNVGGLKEPNLEKINELQPDLIIIAGRQSSFYDKLSEIAPTVSMFPKGNDYMGGFNKNMNIIGEMFDKKEELDNEVNKIDKRIEEIKQEVIKNGYSATTLMVNEGKLSAFGANSRFSIIYNNLGFKGNDENISSGTHGQDVSFEYISKQDSDYIFVVDASSKTSDKKQKSAKEILDNELVNSSKAYKNNNLIYLDTDAWYFSDGGLMSTNTMLDEITKSINK